MNAESITKALGGKWYRRYGTAKCPAHLNTNTPALSLSDGDDGRLLAYCHAGCDFADIMDALRGLGLVEGRGSYNQSSEAELAAKREADRAAREKRSRQALACWNEALPIDNTPAETYLRNRGITAPLPESLRYHPKTWHGPSARRLPAMIALIEGAEYPAIHRTYLQPDGAGKTPVEPNKMMLGAAAGGAVVLADSGDTLVVCEGIETGLALASGMLNREVTIWAALSTSGMAGVNFFNELFISRLLIATDGDDVGRAAGHKLAERASAYGWRVSLLPAPDGKDWADIKMEGVKA